jgi:predicted HNH restriction endonuclease
MLHGAGNTIQRREAATCCSVGKPRLYFVYHERGRVAVWPRWGFGDSDELVSLATRAGLTTGSRKQRESTWARAFPVSIYVQDDRDLQRLLPIMLRASENVRDKAAGPIARDETIALEFVPSDTFPEGGKKTVTLNAYERSWDARSKCVAHRGTRCSVCNFSFEEEYGPQGRGYIHVHHLIPLSLIGADYLVDPLTDLIPVCPNCHEMLHRRQPPFTIDELKDMIRRQKGTSA